jgi:uncharacterized membrane protein HdeD (DUF308 family)
MSSEARSETGLRDSSTETMTETHLLHVFLTRGLVAIAWAIVFVAVAGSSTDVTVGAGVLLVLYPVIDLIASLLDARTQHGSARQLLLANAAVSGVAAVALGVAATGTVADVFAVFGVWALLTGAAQLVVVLHRRSLLGNQWPLLLANGVSIFAGVAFISAAIYANEPKLRGLAIYAFTGGVEFVIQAWLLARRRRRMAGGPMSQPPLLTSLQ